MQHQKKYANICFYYLFWALKEFKFFLKKLNKINNFVSTFNYKNFKFR